MTLLARPQNIATVVKKLQEQLQAWPQLADLKARVERSELLNEDPGACPWICVYRDQVEYRSKTVGYGSGYRDQHISLVVAAQASNPQGGAECEDELEALVAEVVAAILTDTTIGGAVLTVSELKVLYADYRKVGQSFMQTAGVYLTAVVNVSVTQA